jgi:transcriptional regulator with XRE-family HTH domain
MEHEIKLTTGELIMFFRNRKEMTQEALGRILFGDLKTPNVKIKKIEKGQQQLDKEDIEKTADVLGVTPEILQFGKIVVPQINHAADAAKKEKESDYRITKKIDSVCPNLSTYLKAINSMAEVDDMDLMLRILKKMCAEILSTADSTQNKNDKSNRKLDHANNPSNP